MRAVSNVVAVDVRGGRMEDLCGHHLTSTLSLSKKSNPWLSRLYIGQLSLRWNGDRKRRRHLCRR